MRNRTIFAANSKLQLVSPSAETSSVSLRFRAAVTLINSGPCDLQHSFTDAVCLDVNTARCSLSPPHRRLNTPRNLCRVDIKKRNLILDAVHSAVRNSKPRCVTYTFSARCIMQHVSRALLSNVLPGDMMRSPSFWVIITQLATRRKSTEKQRWIAGTNMSRLLSVEYSPLWYLPSLPFPSPIHHLGPGCTNQALHSGQLISLQICRMLTQAMQLRQHRLGLDQLIKIRSDFSLRDLTYWVWRCNTSDLASYLA